MGSCLVFITLCPQHIPRTRNMPPGEQGTKAMKTSFHPNPGEEMLHFPATQPDSPHSIGSSSRVLLVGTQMAGCMP